MSGACAACLIISKLEHLVSTDVVKTCNLSVRESLTMKTITDLLHSVHYDQYRFTSGGQGCRFWVDSVLNLLQNHQITVDENEVQAAREALKRVWGDGQQLLSADEQTDIVPGNFYRVDSESERL